MARPLEYTEEIAQEICAQLSNNVSLRRICQREDMPSIPTVYHWLSKDDEFLKQYRKAREIQHDVQAELVHDLPFECEQMGLDASYTKLKMDGLKWASSKGNPKKYGDRTIHAGDEETPIVVHNTSDDKAIIERYLQGLK